MSNVQFSPTTGAFYPISIDYGDSLPADVIPVTDADYATAVEARAAGSAISFVDGQLIVTPPPVASFADLAAPFMVTVRTIREAMLNRLNGIAVAAQIGGDQATLAACVTARQDLLNITRAPGTAAATDVEGLKAAILAEYRRIVAAAPASIKNAFDEVSA